MGKGISSLKYIKNFNIENRAHKLVADETRKVRPLIQSPRHPSTAKMLEEVESEFYCFCLVCYIINEFI